MHFHCLYSPGGIRDALVLHKVLLLLGLLVESHSLAEPLSKLLHVRRAGSLRLGELCPARSESKSDPPAPHTHGRGPRRRGRSLCR